MGTINSSKRKRKKAKSKKFGADLRNIKSRYILKEIVNILDKGKLLKIIKYNKELQNRLNLSIKNYKDFLEIEIEIIPNKNRYNDYMNIINIENNYYHIYFNNDKIETKRNYLNKNDNVEKIKIVIDNRVKSFKNLFSNCICIESINFIRFKRNNITDMSCMFNRCLSLKELNLLSFNTDNVVDMNGMFSYCTSLTYLNLSSFNVSNVTNMGYMFCGCSSLKELNLSNFKNNVATDINSMFRGCSALNVINLSNFDINKVNIKRYMFSGCSSLKEIYFHKNYDKKNYIYDKGMLYGCSAKINN